MGNASSNRNAGSTKWRLHWGSFRGSSLNLKWSKCGVWWIDQWILTSWLHIEGSRVFIWDIDMIDCIGRLSWLEILTQWFFFVLHWYICLRYLTCWLWDWLSWLRILIFFVLHCHVCSDYLICIDSPLYIIRFDMIDSLSYILSCLSRSMLSLSDILID